MHKRQQYRLVLCGHKAAEVGTACLALMVQGNVADLTLGHFAVASKTAVLALFPALGVTFSRYAGVMTNRWTSAVFLGACGFAADVLVHESHYPGAYTEASLTAVGGAILSLLVSYTTIGRRIDHLAEHLIAPAPQRWPDASLQHDDATVRRHDGVATR